MLSHSGGKIVEVYVFSVFCPATTKLLTELEESFSNNTAVFSLLYLDFHLKRLNTFSTPVWFFIFDLIKEISMGLMAD